jgi:hypothetical protein
LLLAIVFFSDTIEPSTTKDSKMTTFSKKCEKFTTEQLQASLIELYNCKDQASSDAYSLTFEVVCERMGEEAFDTWCDTWCV